MLACFEFCLHLCMQTLYKIIHGEKMRCGEGKWLQRSTAYFLISDRNLSKIFA